MWNDGSSTYRILLIINTYKIMKKELNEKLVNVSESIGTAYMKLTYLNLQYHRVVRDLETTKGELTSAIRELKACNVMVSESDEELTKPLLDATMMLDEGMKMTKHVLAQMRRYGNTVNMLMDANDKVENCLDLLDDLTGQNKR